MGLDWGEFRRTPEYATMAQQCAQSLPQIAKGGGSQAELLFDRIIMAAVLDPTGSKLKRMKAEMKQAEKRRRAAGQTAEEEKVPVVMDGGQVKVWEASEFPPVRYHPSVQKRIDELEKAQREAEEAAAAAAAGSSEDNNAYNSALGVWLPVVTVGSAQTQVNDALPTLTSSNGYTGVNNPNPGQYALDVAGTIHGSSNLFCPQIWAESNLACGGTSEAAAPFSVSSTGAVTSASEAVAGNLTVGGASTLSGNVQVNATVTASNVFSDNVLSVAGPSTLYNNLTVSPTLNANATIYGIHETLTGNLTVDGAATFNGNVQVNATVTASNLFSDNILSVAGKSTVYDDFSVNPALNANATIYGVHETLTGNLTVDGAATFNGALSSANTTFSSNTAVWASNAIPSAVASAQAHVPQVNKYLAYSKGTNINTSNVWPVFDDYLGNYESGGGLTPAPIARNGFACSYYTTGSGNDVATSFCSNARLVLSGHLSNVITYEQTPLNIMASSNYSTWVQCSNSDGSGPASLLFVSSTYPCTDTCFSKWFYTPWTNNSNSGYNYPTWLGLQYAVPTDSQNGGIFVTSMYLQAC